MVVSEEQLKATRIYRTFLVHGDGAGACIRVLLDLYHRFGDGVLEALGTDWSFEWMGWPRLVTRLRDLDAVA